MSGQEIAQRNPDALATLNGDEFRDRVRVLLPDTVGLDKFMGIAATALLENPELAEANQSSVLRSLLACAADGLLPNGKQAALVVFNTKVGDKWEKQASYLPMVKGIVYKLAEYGWHVSAHVVKANDLIWEVTSEPPNIHHRELTVGDRGENIAVYAVARHARNGTRIQRVLYPGEVAKRRAVSKRQKAWDDWTDQYWEKTAVHDIADDLPLDPKERERIVGMLRASDDLSGEEATKMLYGRESVNTQTGELTTGSPASTPAETPADSAEALPPSATDGSGGDDAGLGGEASQEGGDHPPLEAAAQTPSEADELAALEASMFKAPGGKYGAEENNGQALTIGEIYALPRVEGEYLGPDYLKLMLEKGKPGEYWDAIEAFTRSAMPEVYAEIMGRRGEA